MSSAATTRVADAGDAKAESRPESSMIGAMARLLVAVGFAAFVVLIVILPLDLRSRAAGGGSDELFEAALLSAAALIATWALFRLLRRLEPVLDANARAQAHYLDTIDARYVDLAILFSSGLSLLLELSLIRWQSSVLEFLAFYKNFSLLACFAGLGLGYALATRDRIPLLMVIPLLAAQLCFIMLTRMVPRAFDVIPFREQLTMGLGQGNSSQVIVLYLLLSVIFLLTALTLLPIGQLCGRLMERRRNLRAYGLNLLGSLSGVLAMLAASSLWTPPLVWFALCFLG